MKKIQTRILGSGPAGYTASIYAARANLKPVLYQGMEPGGQRMTTNDVENFPGYPDGIMGPHMMACEEALYLSKFATKVHRIVRSNQMRASQIMQERAMKTSTIHVYFNAETSEIPGDAVVTGVRIKNVNTGETKEIAIEGFCVATGHKRNADIFRNYLALDEQGYILTTPGSTKTNMEGVFACDDVQDKHFRQAITAAGTGCIAALEAERFPAAKEVEATL